LSENIEDRSRRGRENSFPTHHIRKEKPCIERI
jgi:hypothetical protein